MKTERCRLGWGWAVLLAVAAPAQAELAKIRWDADGRFGHRFGVPAGAMAELCGPLRRGQAVAWRFEADAATDFNLHYHDQRAVVYPERRPATAAAGDRFVAPKDQTYCWMWENRGPALTTLGVALELAPPR